MGIVCSTRMNDQPSNGDLMIAILDLANATQSGFARVETRLDRVETRLDGVETRLDRVETEMTSLKGEMRGVRTWIERAEARLG